MGRIWLVIFLLILRHDLLCPGRIQNQVKAISLILLPGLDGTGLLFEPLLPCLPAWLHPCVVRYPADEPLGYEQLLPRVEAALPQRAPFLLLGESFSGPLAILAASRAPEGLLGVILCASFALNPMPVRSKRVGMLARPSVIRFFPFGVLSRALLGMRPVVELRERLRDVVLQVQPAVIAARLRAVAAVDVRPALKSCRVPMLYLAARRDAIIPRGSREAIRRAYPALRVVRLDAPHMLLQSAPAQAARAISAFAASAPAPERRRRNTGPTPVRS